MIGTCAILLSDTYKQTHPRMYPKGLTKLVSYMTPRKNMVPGQDTMVFWGLQAFCKEYLIDYFKKNFFDLSENEVYETYCHYMDVQLGNGNYEEAEIMNLYKLGYLPIEIRALPEGTLVNMGVPCVELFNTHPDFAWVVQWVECILQADLWKMCCHATIGYNYRKLANMYYTYTVDDGKPSMAMSDFGMRGMSCLDESVRTSASWLLSFDKTSTIPALPYLDYYYDANCYENKIGIGAVSTEHSVMGANFAIDGDEITFVKRLLTELYPNTSFSMVSDTYDYWNMIDNIIPACRKEIIAHNGKLLVRPDSGDIVDISVKTVQKLWNMFGGHINSKGYKVLDPHIGIIYGDGCTIDRVREIWRQLEAEGFAANCIVFGVGAFCFSGIIDDGKLWAITRDTFGIAMKATYGVINGKQLFIYKDPKTDKDHLKKSHKGCCRVYRNPDDPNKLCCEDEHTEICTENNLLRTMFKNGELVNPENFTTIRNRLFQN